MRRLMAILAHPDDESLGFGGTLAHYAGQGVEVSLVTATRGERGWTGPAHENPGMDALGRLREQELRCAAGVLGVRDLTFLDCIDGDLDAAAPDEVIARLAAHLRRARPQVLITFGPDGAYGHPDHIAISQLATAAAVAAADATFQAPLGLPPHRVAKLYYRVWAEDQVPIYEAVFGALGMEIDGVRRGASPWATWSITTMLDTRPHWRTVWEAVRCHHTQVDGIERLFRLDDEGHERLWGRQDYYRAYSSVNGGRALETDLFAGIEQA